MLRPSLRWMAIAAVLAVPLLAAKAQTSGSAPQTPAAYSAVITRYCVVCHNEKLKTAGLMLDKMDFAKVSDSPEVWEKVVRKLRTRGMPPSGMPRPDEAFYDSFAGYLEGELDHAAAANPNPGRVAVHRLNRTEYVNAVRDLLAVDVNGEELLPADDSGYGFDNIGDVLSVSPVLLERYLQAAARVSRIAVGDPTIAPVLKVYEGPKTFTEESHDDRVSAGLPFGTRGGLAIEHFFPVDGEYEIRVEMERNGFEYIRGILEPHQLQIVVDGVLVKEFTVGGEKHGKSGPIYANSGTLGDTEQEVYERRTGDEGLKIRLPFEAGRHAMAAAFLKETTEAEGALRPRMSLYQYTTYKGGDPAVGSIVIGGPYNARKADDTPSRKKIFVCYPQGAAEEEPCARKIFSNLAHLAYRRPVTSGDVETLLSFYRKGRAAGDFDEGVEMALRRMLVDSEFLLRIERDPANTKPGSSYRISDLELASRLSFFLWSSIPDAELLRVAESGKLRERAVLEQQIRRMTADERSQALVDNFAGQWLYLRNIATIQPDPSEFREFDDNLRAAFERETSLFFGSIVREDRSVIDLLNANYTFLNERLARHYGIPNVYGSRFRRVTLSADDERRGLLGQGSLLTVTSYANRTSPVLRGKWILENILGTPPPPPPPNVPAFPDNPETGRALTVRERMETHRSNPVCATCHRVMDPLGFSLENFDAVGRWRTKEAGGAVDAVGQLADGTVVNGPVSLRQALVKRPAQFVGTMTEKLMTYALGRGLEAYDMPVVRSIAEESARSNYRFSTIITGIVESTPFQMKNASEDLSRKP
jgi:mono/diheme cytochrome c family protein